VKFYLILAFIYILFSSCQNQSRSISSLEVKDIVFDLDWTLIKQLKRGENLDGPNILKYENEVYRLNDGVVELLKYLDSKDDVRLSFFSGGSFNRNIAVLEQIKLNGKNAKDMAYKVLSKKDLDILSTDSSLTFTDRYKKNLLLVNKDLSNVIIIDDDVRFAVNDEQKKNFLWLESVKYHFESPRDIKTGNGPFDPRSVSEWFFDKNKIQIVHEILEKSLDGNSNKHRDFPARVALESRKWNFKENKFSPSQSRKYLKLFNSNDCHDLMLKFFIWY
jgi:hypothetical protein